MVLFLVVFAMEQAYYNPHLLYIVEALLAGGRSVGGGGAHTMGAPQHTRSQSSFRVEAGFLVFRPRCSGLLSFPVPPEFYDRPFIELFVAWISSGKMAVAVYRHRGVAVRCCVASCGVVWLCTDPPYLTFLRDLERRFCRTTWSHALARP